MVGVVVGMMGGRCEEWVSSSINALGTVRKVIGLPVR